MPPFPPELWEQTPVAVQLYIRTLEARVAALEATVQRLLERLKQDSQNSSRPPSSDPPHALKPRSRRMPSGRKRGGQPGHHGPDPGVAPAGGGGGRGARQAHAVCPLSAPLAGEDPQPHRHQVTELPPVKPVVTEYQLHRLVCPACGASTRAPLPVGVPPGGFGPAGASHRGAVHGRVSPVEADDPGGHGRPVRAVHEPGDDSQSGAGHRAGRGGTSGRGPDLCPHATRRALGRDGMARRAHAGLVVGGCHHVGHGLCGPPVAWGQGGTGAVGGTVLWHPGDGPLERLYVVSDPVAAGLLGASAAGL